MANKKTKHPYLFSVVVPEMAVFYKGDAVEQMKKLPAASVDLIYIDPPFGTTQAWWDSKINWKAWFTEAYRLLKPTGNIVIHCSQPFTYTLIREAPYAPHYHWIWNKVNTTLPFVAKIQPLRCCEEILVFKGRGKGVSYYPQRVGTEERTFRSQGRSLYYGAVSEQPLQTVKGRYQTHYISMKKSVDGFATRPPDLIRLMINSYSKPSDTILDTFCYNGESFASCSDRRWIGIDKYHVPKWLAIGVEKI
jgi:DNA modification methylase